MSRAITRHIAHYKPISSICLRTFSTSIRTQALQPTSRSPATPTPTKAPLRDNSDLNDLINDLTNSLRSSPSAIDTRNPGAYGTGAHGHSNPYHLHCYATKHNTHVTFTRPDRTPIISVSAGNLGFRKAGRGTYEAAFQTSAYVMRMLQEKGHFTEASENYVKRIELVLRGFAEGRTAFLSALMGVEGRLIRPKIVKLCDATRLKIGGTRSRNPRRLG